MTLFVLLMGSPATGGGADGAGSIAARVRAVFRSFTSTGFLEADLEF